MRTEREAEMDGFKKGLDMAIDMKIFKVMVVGTLAFILGFGLGLLA